MDPTTTQPGAPKTRDTLKQYFQPGSLPTSQNFADLIDSAVNRLDDGFSYAPEYGLEVTATDDLARLAAFYRSANDLEARNPAWFIELPTDDQADGLSFSTAPQVDPDASEIGPPPPGTPRLHLRPNGYVGIGTTAPAEQLDVRGFVASAGRIGTYATGSQVPADGEWHSIVTGLSGLHAFEIVAAAYGPVRKGRYALTHATALGAYGRSRSRIYRRNAWFWGWFQKIQFRWTGDLYNYGLEMRTASSFGAGSTIVYHVTHLFDNRDPRPAAEAAQ